MTKQKSSSSSSSSGRGRITLERIYAADLEEVWQLWTTKDGIESWWGPDGFGVVVKELDVRPGGRLLYDMQARGAEQIAFMKQAGMPVSHPARITFTEVVPERRLAYLHAVDFVPGLKEAYDVGTEVDLDVVARGVRMRLTFDVMHDPLWTDRQKAGWEMELDKLHRLIEKMTQNKQEKTMSKITPFLWFNDNAEDAAKFYVSVFKGSRILSTMPGGPGGKPMTVELELDGQRLVFLNGGPTFQLTEAFSLSVSVESQQEVDALWSTLTADGGAESQCGWLKDRFGLSWQIVPVQLMRLLNDRDPGRAQRSMQAMLKMKKIIIKDLEAAADAKS
jgi:predicted 3-demethylubiquinone-9 3-methyltransferase (glyoxalase superfamily)/uncharacterized protein YndB with AHSA1/START domain